MVLAVPGEDMVGCGRQDIWTNGLEVNLGREEKRGKKKGMEWVGFFYLFREGKRKNLGIRNLGSQLRKKKCRKKVE